MPCNNCKTLISKYEVFPGGLCLGCFEKTEAGRRMVTAEELVAMWGGPIRRR